MAADREAVLVEALRAGDEAAFAALVERYHAGFVRVAIDRFEARSSLKTWLYRILTNRAKTRGERESRTVPFSSIGDADEPAVDPDSFRPEGDQYPGGWKEFPTPWEGDPEERLLAGEARALILDAIEQLPSNQRAVITLRDIEGFDADDVCNFL